MAARAARLLLLAALAGRRFVTAPLAGQRVVHVAPDASEAAGDGSRARPYGLAAAVRAIRGHAAGTTVLLHGGDYLLSDPLVLTAADGGVAGRPVTYASAPGERARLVGGVELKTDAFHPVAPSATGHNIPELLVTDLRAAGVHNASLLGGAGVDGLKPELYLSDGTSFVPQQLAQDPSPNPDGTWRWAGGDSIIETERGPTWFVLNSSTELERWCAAANSSSGLHLFGHWGDQEGVQDALVQSISQIPPGGGATHSYNISLEPESWMSRFPPGLKGQHFVAADSLELVDRPGEYWIDRESLQLYYIRPSGSSGQQLFLSLGPSLASPLASMKHPQALVQLQGTPHVSLINITIAASTQMLLAASSVQGLVVEGAVLHGGGAACASLDGNTSTIRDSEIAHCGGTGLTLRGGNWNRFGPSLFVSANQTVVGNRISDWARWQRTPNSAGIDWSGVGHLVHGNLLMNAPEPAVAGNGNVDCIFEHNEIFNVNWEQSDMGAYYHGSSAGGYNFGWTQPGNVIRGNTWKKIRFQESRPTEKAYSFTTQAIYMDDELSGYTIADNHFIDVDVGVLIGGGRHHTVRNNSFEGCGTACIHVDNRGMNWAHELCGCQCAFNVCVPGCSNGADIGPGLAQNLSAPDGSFRFEQGLRELHCLEPGAAPPCHGKKGLEWLADVLHDTAGGGACAPAHNVFADNRFDEQSCRRPWQICGDPKNASKMHHNCGPNTDANPAVLEVWGSQAVGNAFIKHELPAASGRLPVMPWPERDHTSPVSFAPWLVNWDIGYYGGNETRLAAALNLSDPDIFEWDFGSENNAAHALSSRGILASSHQSHEWQQTSGAPDTNAEFTRNFLNNGMGREEGGELERLHEDSGNLSSFMSQMAPKWHALTKEGNIRAVAYGQTVTQDNVGNYYGVFHEGHPSVILPQSQMPYGGGFTWGPWINYKFVRAYSHLQLAKVLPPLPNGTHFSLVAHIAAQRAKGLTPIQLTREPILHEYIRFTQNATVGRWVDMRRGAQAQVKKEPRSYPVGVYGNLECMAFQANDACGWQQNRQPIMTAPWVDVIVLEAATVMQEYKVALAAGNFEKPVFPFPDTCAGLCEGPTALARAMGATPASTTSHARWYGDYRHLFTDRRSVADVAVLLDLPVFFWRGFSSLATPGDQPHVLAMQNMTALLDELHTPYDVLFEGHPDFYDDTKHWARVHSYSTLVLPRVESISDAHVGHIRRFATNGGHVVVLGDASGITDEEDRLRATHAFASLRKEGLVTWVNDSVFTGFMQNRTGTHREEIASALRLQEEPLITTDLPTTVPLHVWLHGNGPMLSIQMANADTARTTNATSGASHTITLRLGQDVATQPDTVQFYSWSLAGGKPIQLPFNISDGRMRVVVPPFERFGAVVMGEKGEAECRATAGMVRKLTERLELATTVTPGQTVPSDVLNHSRKLLATVQGASSSVLTAGTSPGLLSHLNSTAKELGVRLKRIPQELAEFNRLSRETTTNATGAVVRVDFSSSPSPPPAGWHRVGPTTKYDPSSSGSAGWTDMPSLAHPGPAPAALRMKGSSGVPQPCPFATDAVLCSYLFGNTSQRSNLSIALPHAGNFSVEIVLGDPSAMVTRIALTNVWSGVTGDLLAVGSRMPVQGEFTSIAFRATVPEPPSGQEPTLSLSLGGMAVSQFFEFDDRSTGGHAANGFYFTLAWIVNALIVRELDTALPEPAAQSLSAHAAIAAGVRDWMILGPLDDSNATCIDDPAAVAAPQVNVSQQYPRKGGGAVGWQRIRLNASLAYLDFTLHGVEDVDGLGASALAMTHVKVTGDAPTRAVLVGSTAGVGASWLGSKQVLRDELNVGLLVDEERVEVVLQPGWNEIVVMGCTKWAAPGWGLWLGLQDLNGRPLQGVLTDACGPLC